MEWIYVDHAATSPMHPKVIDRMTSVMTDIFGNPSSIHYFGRQARQIIDEARAVLASSIGAKENEIIFTSGGTEADNLAILGVAEAYRHAGRHILTTQVEHHAVLHTCQQLEKQGYEVTYLPVDEQGRVSIEDVKSALRPDTILVTIMYGNNEVGTIQPIKEIGEILKNHQALFHTDAVQAYGIEKLAVSELGVDLLSVSAHKINGPKGIGFLYAHQQVKLSSRMFGGEQERKRRAGTENVSAIAGFCEAVKISQIEMETKREQYEQFREQIISRLNNQAIDFSQNGLLDYSLPHVLNLSFPNTNVEAMLVNLDLAGIAASSGSACTAGSIDPSHVLVAMFGKGSERLSNSIRFSFGLYNTAEQMQRLGDEVASIVQRLTK
ncbi:cysteine desulfurase [Cytobacillus spongiae]|uniref:cysteine desulfurase family protein n=1 Tax=Cytobacillus spongiae TaxID=2901381 RepID=UPI001F221CC9|nr:cysteine desulfurase family protein [Cytobacillus spongiae]UII54986.1 cysteine desulfurase [Cytobacillus spongiae]